MSGFRGLHILSILILLVFSCNNKPQEKKPVVAHADKQDSIRNKYNRKIACELPVDYSKVDTTKSYISSSVAYSYDIATIPSNFPADFIDQSNDITEDTDTLNYLLLKNKDASYVIWYESIPFESAIDVHSMPPSAKAKAEAQVDSLLNTHLTNGIPRLGKIRITYHCLGLEGISHNILICAEDDTYGYIYKHVTGNIPYSHASVHFIYKYRKAQKATYWDLGAFLAMSLGGSPETI